MPHLSSSPAQHLRKLFGALLLLPQLLLPLLGTAQAAETKTPPLQVAVSFSILADFTQTIGGEQLEVISLVGPNEDVHAFQPRPSDARRVGKAALVIVNGLGFDDWMSRLARAGGYRGEIVVASTGVSPLAGHAGDDSDGDHEHEDEHGHAAHSHGEYDPHAWLDVRAAKQYVRNIAAALANADPAHAKLYAANLNRYLLQLEALDEEIRHTLAGLAADQRRAVSSHDAFAYFSHAYGIDFLAPAGLASHAEASAKSVARLIEQLRREQVPAVFLENIVDPRLIERIASESGARIGGTLYADALSGRDGPATSYLALMRHNLATLVSALSPGSLP